MLWLTKRRVSGRQQESSRNRNPGRTGASVGAADRLTIAWRPSKFDRDGPRGLDAFGDPDMPEFIRQTLCPWETMTRAELFRASGGRNRGNNQHPLRVQLLSKHAKDRLVEIRQDDIDRIYSLRIKAVKRLYGIRNSQAFEILWYDPRHNKPTKTVYPVRSR